MSPCAIPPNKISMLSAEGIKEENTVKTKRAETPIPVCAGQDSLALLLLALL